jgi:hypothetical protein
MQLLTVSMLMVSLAYAAPILQERGVGAGGVGAGGIGAGQLVNAEVAPKVAGRAEDFTSAKRGVGAGGVGAGGVSAGQLANVQVAPEVARRAEDSTSTMSGDELSHTIEQLLSSAPSTDVEERGVVLEPLLVLINGKRGISAESVVEERGILPEFDDPIGIFEKRGLMLTPILEPINGKRGISAESVVGKRGFSLAPIVDPIIGKRDASVEPVVKERGFVTLRVTALSKERGVDTSEILDTIVPRSTTEPITGTQ